MERTKEAIVRSFSELLREKPYNKITVKDIVERCGITRNTFYYHFHDIPTLLEERVTEEVERIIALHYKADQPIECILPLIRYSEEHREAILHIYHYADKDFLLISLNRITVHLLKEFFDALTQGKSVDQEDVDVLILFYKSAFLGIMLDWVDNNMKYDLGAKLQRLSELAEGTTSQAMARMLERGKHSD